MSADTAAHRSVWEQATARLLRSEPIPPRTWDLDDTDVPVIGAQVLGEYPGIAWALQRGSTARPANGTDRAKYARQRWDLDWAREHGDPYCVLAVAPSLPDVRVTAPEPAAEPEPRPEDAEDPQPVPGPIAQMAAETNGLGPLDKAQEAAFTAFSADHDAEDKRTATVQLAAVGDATEVTPAVTEEAS